MCLQGLPREESGMVLSTNDINTCAETRSRFCSQGTATVCANIAGIGMAAQSGKRHSGPPQESQATSSLVPLLSFIR